MKNTNHSYKKAKQQHRIITKLHSVCYTQNYFPVVYPSILGWFSGVAQRHPRSIQHYSSAVGEPQLQGKTSDRCMHGYIHYPKEKPPCFRVISAVSSEACSDLIYAGHRPLYPLLMTMLAKSRSQDEWGFHSERTDSSNVFPLHPPPPPLHTHTHQSPQLCGFSDSEGFDQNCLEQGKRQEHEDWGHCQSMAFRATEVEKTITTQWSIGMRTITDDAMEVRADLRPLDWITNRDYCQRILPMSGRSGKGSICSAGQEGSG